MISSSLFSKFVLLDTIIPDTNTLQQFGQNIKWITSDLIGVVENINDQETVISNVSFIDGTYFDGYNTLFEEKSPETIQKLNIFQVLTTDRNWISSATDTIQLTKVKEILTTSTGLIYDGKIESIFITENSIPDNTVTIYNNTNLSHGWTVSTSQELPIDSTSISRAWIYDSVTNIKLTDLEIVDLVAGIIPGKISQNLDYISDIDPALYNIPLWTPGTIYNINDRVVYGNNLYQALYAGKSGSIFNSALWTLIKNNPEFVNLGNELWGNNQVGKTWFKTKNLKTIDAQLGNLKERAANWNQWLPNSTIEVYEWVNSSSSPTNYINNDNNGYVLDNNCPYTFNSYTGMYGFWVYGKTTIGSIHNMSCNQLITALQDIPNSGIPMITALDTNAVAVWNINQFISSNTVVLHIDYVLESANNQLHNEFALIGNDGTKSWYKTPIYSKFIDSLSGVSILNQLIPDITLPYSQQTGILSKPQQSIFVNRITALDIYYSVINSQLANLAIATSSIVSSLSAVDPIPTTGFNQTITNRDILNQLNINDYPENYRILLLQDDTLKSNYWSIVSATSGKWVISSHQLYNLSTDWKYTDWSSSAYANTTPTYTLSSIGDLPEINYSVGDIIQLNDNGSGNIAIYMATKNDIDANITELDPIYIQNGTIQFLPDLYDFITSKIGFDSAPFDSAYFDNDPYIDIRLITEILNNVILIGNSDLTTAADNAFYAVIQYIIHENKNLDWLFKTSFISVDYNNRDLSVQGNFEPDNQTTIEDFIAETAPYHTRVREFHDIYTAKDYANIGLIDFDLPAQYDGNYANIVLDYTNNVKPNGLLQLSQFYPNVGVFANTSSFFITSNGLPNHATDTFPNSTDPYTIEKQNWSFGFQEKIYADSIQFPTVNNNVGPIASAVNGVPFYNSNSGETETLYLLGNLQVKNTYTINTVWEAQSIGLDPGKGFPNENGAYQYFTDPYLMYEKNANIHSSIIGYAWDGVPIYGSYGYENSDGSGNIIMNSSSYQLSNVPRLDKTDQPIVNGLQLAIYSAPTGEYIEDFIYVPNSGTLDKNNGRWCVTPEYPAGTYAYFSTIDSLNNPIYPYIIGPNYFALPYNLEYSYVNGINTPLYPNGDVSIPYIPTTDEISSYIRTPDGSISSDPTTLQLPIYSPWNNNYTYSIGSIDVIIPGKGYSSSNLAVQIISTDGNGGNVIANATIGNTIIGSIGTINIIDGGNNFTSTPKVLITADSNVIIDCVAYPRLENSSTRKIKTSIRFDRVNPTVEFLYPNTVYSKNTVAFNSNNNIFVRSLVNNANSANINNSNIWGNANISTIVSTTAMNRIQATYFPTANMFANQARLLMTGVEYPGVTVNGGTFIESYSIPSGSLYDLDDSSGFTSLNIAWHPNLLTNSAISRNTFRFGNSSAYFNAEKNQYITVNSSSPNISYLENTSNIFTLEFFCNFEDVSTTSVLIDTRNNISSNIGIVIYKNENNNICVGSNSNIALLESISNISTHNWNFITLQEYNNDFYLYVNGELENSSNLSIAASNFNLTLGADVNGQNGYTGYIDELRLTNGVNRYTIGSTSIIVPTEPFPLNITNDPYYVSNYTPLLLTFEDLTNDAIPNISLNSINSTTYINDLSWNQKKMEIINYSNSVIVDSTLLNNNVNPQSSLIMAVTLNK